MDTVHIRKQAWAVLKTADGEIIEKTKITVKDMGCDCWGQALDPEAQKAYEASESATFHFQTELGLNGNITQVGTAELGGGRAFKIDFEKPLTVLGTETVEIFARYHPDDYEVSIKVEV